MSGEAPPQPSTGVPAVDDLSPLHLFMRTYMHACQSFGAEVEHSILQCVTKAVADSTNGMLCMRLPHVGLGGWESLCPALACLPVTHLTTEDYYVGDEGLRALSQSIAHATAHTLPNPAVMHPSVRFMMPHCLQVLHLRGVGIKDGSLLLPLLSAATNLYELDLSWNQLGMRSAGLAVLCTALRLHPSMRSVSFASNYLDGRRGGVTVAALAELVAASGHVGSTLVSLHLHDNQLGMYFIGGEPSLYAHTVTRARTEALPLRDLHIGCATNSSAAATHPLLDALILNNNLEVLSLEHNALPDALVMWVEARLRVNRRSKVAFQLQGATGSSRLDATQAACASESVAALLSHTEHVILQRLAGGPPPRPPPPVPAAVACNDGLWTTDEVRACVRVALDALRLERGHLSCEG